MNNRHLLASAIIAQKLIHHGELRARTLIRSTRHLISNRDAQNILETLISEQQIEKRRGSLIMLPR